MKFSNVYIEKEIENSSITLKILRKIKYNKIIICDKYSEVFNPKNQNFRIQKKNPSIILAKKKKKFFLKPHLNLQLDLKRIITFLTC